MDLLIDDPNISASDLLTSRNIAETLHAKYPGHLWAVNVAHGVADIRNLYLAGNWGYRIVLPKVFSASQLADKATKAGGEILERFNLSRGVADSAAISSLGVDRKGRVLGDYAR